MPSEIATLNSRLTASPAIRAAAFARRIAAPAPDLECREAPWGTHQPADPETAAENTRREAQWHAQKAARHTDQDRRSTERLALFALLRECGCQVFDRPQPLAIGINAQLRALVGDAVPAVVIKDLLRRWTRSEAYLAALAEGRPRVHLDGSSAGPVSDDHRQHAATQLAAMRHSSRTGAAP